MIYYNWVNTYNMYTFELFNNQSRLFDLLTMTHWLFSQSMQKWNEMWLFTLNLCHQIRLVINFIT